MKDLKCLITPITFNIKSNKLFIKSNYLELNYD